MSRKSWDERIKQVEDLLLLAVDILQDLREEMEPYSYKSKSKEVSKDEKIQHK